MSLSSFFSSLLPSAECEAPPPEEKEEKPEEEGEGEEASAEKEDASEGGDGEEASEEEEEEEEEPEDVRPPDSVPFFDAELTFTMSLVASRHVESRFTRPDSP